MERIKQWRGCNSEGGVNGGLMALSPDEVSSTLLHHKNDDIELLL